jgi:hypothetical protein
MSIPNAFLLLSIALLQGARLPQAPHLRMMFNQLGYVSPTHMDPPSGNAQYVFLEGDPVELSAKFVNWSKEVVVIPAQSQSPSQSIRTDLIVRPGKGRQSGVPVSLEESGRVFLTEGSTQSEVQWGAPITVPPGASLSVPLTLRTPKLAPDVYELRVSEILLQCESPCKVLDQGGFCRFEIRAADQLPARLDQLYRRGLHAVGDGTLDDVDGIIQQILAQYPTSSAAYELRGRQREARQQWRDAAEAYEFAARLIESRRDQLRRSDGEPGALAEALHSLANSTRRRLGKQ